MRNLDYTTADIEGGYTPGKEIIDVTEIPKPDNLFDVVICIHVLQHVKDDAKAMREIFRVLKPGGWAILNSRMDPTLETTLETLKPRLPEDERKAMQANELYRVYGRDLKRRLETAGFAVKVDRYLASLDERTVERCFLHTMGDVYLCKKCG
jgi:ubiquinone/menaquinone biosynthesis C-methylase UbiE